jgi:signal transduction histidine kinase
LDAAWGTIPQTRESAANLGSFTRTRVERIISLIVAIGCLALGTQSFTTALGSVDERPGWKLGLGVLVFVPLAAMIVTGFVGRANRLFAAVFAVVFPLTLLLWPIATSGSELDPAMASWIFYPVNLATVAAVLAFPLPLQVAWTILVPLVYGAVRMIQAGFGQDFWLPVILDVSFALILGGILLTLGWAFRAVAANVDDTRARAVDSYARAAAADAVEKERVSVAALMHDSVLAALISAERAHSDRERTLAVSMAREALTRLANTERDASMGTEEPVALGALADGIESTVAETGTRGRIERHIADASEVIPGGVARAIMLAVAQAVTNSVKHADAAGLEVIFDGASAPVEVQVRVTDEGPGFDPDAVPADRLGISASIIARVAAVGGHAEVESGPEGTTVTVRWQGTS